MNLAFEEHWNTFLSWEKASRDTIDFKKSYVDIAGDLIGGLVLSEIIYWYLPDRTGVADKLRVIHEEERWIAIRYKDWWDRARITISQAERAINILIKVGIVEKKIFKFNGNPTVHVRIIKDKFLELMQSNAKAESTPVVAGIELGYNRSPLTETTTQTTTDIKDLKDAVETEFLQKSPPPILRVPRTAEDVKAMTREALEKGYDAHEARLKEGISDTSNYPPEVLATIGKVCELWKITPPRAKDQRFGYWIKGAKELQEACGEFGLALLGEVYENWKVSGYTVASPTSLVNSAVAMAGRKRGQASDIPPAADPNLSYRWDSELPPEENERLMRETMQRVKERKG